MYWAAVGLSLLVGLGMTQAAAAESAESGASTRRAVVLTTDCGTDMDDQWALAHLALSPEIELRGVVTTHALGLPAPAAEFTARTAREVLANLPLKHAPPVIAGSSVALAEKAKPLPNAGVDLLLQQSRRFSASHRLAVLVIGAATDLASALLTDPTLGDRIEIVAMGFYRWPDGGDEWNIKNDPKAWQVLLESRAPITVGDQAVCKRDLRMTPAKANALFAQRGKAGRYLAHIFTDWMEKHPGLLAEGFWPVWDEVVTAHLLGLTRTEAHPRPTLDDAMHLILPTETAQPARAITWIVSLDTARLWDDFTRKLERAQAEQAQ